MISVLMPVNNNLRYLMESINSVLAQSYEDFELIIVDDGSTEPVWDALNALNDPRIKKYRNNEKKGIPYTLNRMLDISKGDFICRQDSDDISDPDRFMLQVDALNSGYDFVISRYGKINHISVKIEDDWINEINDIDVDYIRNNIKNRNFIVGGAPMWTRRVFDEIGYFDSKLRVAQDYNYWIRILHHYNAIKIDEVVYFHRKHNNSHRLSTPQYMIDDNITQDYNSLAQHRAIENLIIKN